MDAEKQVQAGSAAERFLADETFTNAVAKLKVEYVRQIVESPVNGQEQRESAYRKHRVLDELIGQIQNIIDNGSLVKSQLTRVRRNA